MEAALEQAEALLFDLDGTLIDSSGSTRRAWSAFAVRHGLDPEAAETIAAGVFRSDLYRLHLGPAGADLPAASAKVEGSLGQPTPVASSRGKLILAPDRFFDAQVFDPGLPA